VFRAAQSSEESDPVHATLPLLEVSDFPAIRRERLETLQVNLGYKCNQTCVHCHVNAGPTRTEQMDRETMQTVLRYLEASGVGTLDITGGAPELNPHFRELVERARALGAHVIDRCNLTILEEPGQGDLADFLAGQGVEIVASLPCYTEELVDRQRGKGVYETSIRALQRLNALGYGIEGSGLALNLVYNPQGASLPPAQEKLEADYKRVLGERFGIRFNRLYTLANMPIARFGSTLISKGRFNAYLKLLRESFREENLQAVMCRSLISVDWQGYVYDCDFNQMLGLPLRIAGRSRVKLGELIGRDLAGNPIVVKDHCFGCTAGQGSSCGGALDG
jgi:radical SAM/Cys-rich protein